MKPEKNKTANLQVFVKWIVLILSCISGVYFSAAILDLIVNTG